MCRREQRRSESFVCPLCGQHYASNSNLTRHIDNVHARREVQKYRKPTATTVNETFSKREGKNKYGPTLTMTKKMSFQVDEKTFSNMFKSFSGNF